MSRISEDSSKMLGAIVGDTIGSVYEWNNIKYKLKSEDMATGNASFTDDSVMTCAVAYGIINGLKVLPKDWMSTCLEEGKQVLMREIALSLKKYGREYPYIGYGGSFLKWLFSDDMGAYNSWGNGSAMRVSFAGWIAHSLAEAEVIAECSAAVTHNHPEGIKGAVAVAGSIFILLDCGNKDEVRKYASKYYDVNFTLDDIRDSYYFDVSCQGSVPQAIVAFLTADSFVDIIANAISIGGDSDTIAAIAGSIAETIYPIPKDLRERVISRLDENLLSTISYAVEFIEKNTANKYL